LATGMAEPALTHAPPSVSQCDSPTQISQLRWNRHICHLLDIWRMPGLKDSLC